MIPVIVAGIAGLASFVGITLLSKNATAANLSAAGKTGIGPVPSAPPPPAVESLPSFALPVSKPSLGLPPLIAPPPAPPVLGPLSSLPLSPFLQPKADGGTTVAFNPDGSPHTLGTPFVATTNADARSIVDVANSLGLAVFELELLRTGAGKLAVVTTNDPSPAGDLIIRTQPSTSAPQIPGGGADKGATVTIIRQVDGTFSEVFWRGGNRPLGQGFAKTQFLRVVPNPILT